MAAREESGTNIDPGILARVVAGVRYAVSGVTPMSWFGPGQPLPPVAQKEAEGRAFDFPVNFNQNFTPRGGEPVSFAQLRALADGYDLMRLVIETRKDQIAAFDWEIQPISREISADSLKDDIKAATDLFMRPDREHDWPEWCRMLLEELLVIDTICVYPRKNRGGGMWGFEPVDGALIKRVLDETGRTPLPPDPAYQQVIKGVPAVSYTSDTLVYRMRNPRVSRIYGYSPVEQVITTVNIAMRRQLSQLEFYTSGNVPEALIQAPEGWNANQIKDFQTWWDSVMEGNLAQRRKMRLIPGIKEVYFPKEALLKDEFDEWLARIVCFAFSISPASLIKQVNRASGEQIADTAKEEGLMPLLRFIESFLTYLVQKYLKQPQLRFAFKVVNRVAPEQQAEIHEKYVAMEAMTPDEVRDELGMDALPEADREKAFPKPPAPGMGPDGKPLPAPKAEAPPKPKGPSEAEKILLEAVRMLDPSLVASAIEKAAKAHPPTVIEHKPNITVEVGDVNVHNQAEKLAPALLAKSAASESLIAEGLHALANRPPDSFVVNVPETRVDVHAPHTINVAPAAVHHTTNVAPAAVSVAPAAIQIDAPVTVHTPEAKVDVHVNVPPPGASEEIVERDYNGEVGRIVKRPIK